RRSLRHDARQNRHRAGDGGRLRDRSAAARRRRMRLAAGPDRQASGAVAGARHTDEFVADLGDAPARRGRHRRRHRRRVAAPVVLGPGAPPHLENEIGKVAPRFEIIRAPNDLPRLMAEADLGVISFGVTAYELAALGVPALYLCLTPDHALSASAFEAAGMGISLGVAGEVNDMMIAGAVQSLLGDPERRR